MTVTRCEMIDMPKLIREVATEADSPDVDVVTKLVADAVPEEFLRDALRWAIRREVTDIIGSRVIRNARQAACRPSGTRWDGAGRIYRSFMGMSVDIGGPERKFARDLTANEVLAARDTRSKKAEEMAVEAARWGKFASEMRKAKVSVLGELPEAVVVEVLRWQP